MDFITDMGKSYDVKLLASKPVHIGRYGLWRYDMAKGKHQVFETSDDLEYLKIKYCVDEVVELAKIFVPEIDPKYEIK